MLHNDCGNFSNLVCNVCVCVCVGMGMDIISIYTKGERGNGWICNLSVISVLND